MYSFVTDTQSTNEQWGVSDSLREGLAARNSGSDVVAELDLLASLAGRRDYMRLHRSIFTPCFTLSYPGSSISPSHL